MFPHFRFAAQCGVVQHSKICCCSKSQKSDTGPVQFEKKKCHAALIAAKHTEKDLSIYLTAIFSTPQHTASCQKPDK
jgi:hypothetical protein